MTWGENLCILTVLVQLVRFIRTGGMLMIHLNYRDGRPIYVQIVDGLRGQIQARILLPGEQLPSVRELAAELAIYPNTIQRA